VELALAVAADRSITALTARAWSDAGCAVSTNVARQLRGVYPNALRDLADFSVVTNAPPGKPFRGPGGPPAYWALEQAVDEVAGRLGVDPVELRQGWDRDPVRKGLYDWAVQQTPWADRESTSTGRWRRGWGFAIASWHHYVQTDSIVDVSCQDGVVTVKVAAQDIGTGTRTLLADTVRGLLAVPQDRIRVHVGDSRLPQGPFSAGSSATTSLVPAAAAASAELRSQLTAFATREFGLLEAVPAAEALRHRGGAMTWVDVLDAGPSLSARGRRPRDRGGYRFPSFLLRGFAIGRATPSAAQVVEVLVDTDLGRIKVERVFCGVASGRVFAPTMAASQCQGAVIQALGMVLAEEQRVDPITGLVTTTDFGGYVIPRLADTPDIAVSFLPGGFDHVAQGGVGLAEIAVLPLAPAVGNAVFAATGKRPYSMPIPPAFALGRTP
jgi:xanthine dehydrogenase YagR molybdenum-binding subunit